MLAKALRIALVPPTLGKKRSLTFLAVFFFFFLLGPMQLMLDAWGSHSMQDFCQEITHSQLRHVAERSTSHGAALMQVLSQTAEEYDSQLVGWCASGSCAFTE